MKNHWIMDDETLVNCFVAVYEHYATDEKRIFVIHDLRNDFFEYVRFLKTSVVNKEWNMTFNGLAFDGQITQYILNSYTRWTGMGGCEIAFVLYQYAQSVITKSDSNQFLDFPEWKQQIQQVDLYKMNHWDNPAKRSSLKKIQFSMDWYNVQEMPIHHSTIITTMEQINEIISYCCNDVSSTKEVYKRSKDLITLRKNLSLEYGMSLYSASEPRISKELFGYFLSERLDIDKRELRLMRTQREKIVLKDIILPYIKFETPEFKRVLDIFMQLDIHVTPDLRFSENENLINGKKFTITHKKVVTDYALGGIHGVIRKGIYTGNSDTIIMTSDVTSFYPNLAIRNKWSPAHLPKEQFCELYEWFFEERKKIPKKDPKNYVYKIILNSTYGLSNDRNCFLYDPEFTMRITVNGQLLLTMLYEMLSTRIPGSQPLMQNTDGLEMMIPKEYKQLYLEICKEWEDMTMLQLEHDEYTKMVIADVNNYIAVSKEKKVKAEPGEEKKEWMKIIKSNPHYPCRSDDDGFYYTPVKCKGRFEFHELALHKDKSFLIIPKAIYEYFVSGVSPDIFLLRNRNIFDYCGGIKALGDWYYEERSITDGAYTTNKLQKLVRYYVSHSGKKLIKCNPDGRTAQVEAGRWMQTVFNVYEEKDWKDYGVNDEYYLQKIYSEINGIDANVTRKYQQLEIF